MTDELRAELAAAGYSEKEIAREAAIMERAARENEAVRNDRAWNYGFHHAEGE